MGWLTATLVTTEEKLQYTAIIDAILATADLETISRKKIRQGLETSLGGKDLSEQKVVFSFFFLPPFSGNLQCNAGIVVIAVTLT